ncbi:hypothetical protein DL96DRAFT_1649219 [Flagelloscypha sp. PMI_526]|nr:hypothetical protein DL96DRAFT_1649219 [Flagelloscypha sp. PMI_526]
MALGFGGVAAWSIATVPATDVAAGEDQCPQPGISTQTAIRHAVAWECMFAFDGIIFVLTLTKSYRGTRESGRRFSVPILDVMLRDGAIYFLVMIIANAANVATFYALGPRLRGSLSTMASTVSVTMTSRLILNIHQKADHLNSSSLYGDSSNGIRRPLTRRRRAGTNEDESPEPLDTLRTADYLHSVRVMSQDGTEILRDQQRRTIPGGESA